MAVFPQDCRRVENCDINSDKCNLKYILIRKAFLFEKCSYKCLLYYLDILTYIFVP
jgi:hypothetical protein